MDRFYIELVCPIPQTNGPESRCAHPNRAQGAAPRSFGRDGLRTSVRLPQQHTGIAGAMTSGMRRCGKYGGNREPTAEPHGRTPVLSEDQANCCERGRSMRVTKFPLMSRLLGLALSLTLIVTLVTLGALPRTQAAAKVLAVGITLPLTGADAEDAELIKDGAVLAIEEANAKGGVAGYKIEIIILDSGTATAGQYDPAQAATNTKKLVANKSVVANIGPQMSGEGKAMSPILSAGNLATITPSSTNPDITSPKFAAQFRPNGKAIYFRTVTTDAYQGPNMANYYADTLKVKSVYVLDDSGAYGVGIADSFQKQAEARGIKVLGRDQLNPKEADYTTILTKIKAANPDAMYYGGVAQAGVKLCKQAYDVNPKMIKGGGDGMVGPEILKGAGFPAAEGWYATIAGPHLL